MRRFGVEIEAGLQAGRTLQDVQAALAAAGLGGERQGYSGYSQTSWVVKTDGSVSGGVEVVSPPLDFDDEAQRGQVDRAVAAIQGTCTTHRSAGIHVHVESSDLNAEQLAGVARTFVHFEDVLFRLASSGWTTIRPGSRTYCKPFGAEQAKKLAKAKTDNAIRTAYYESPRHPTTQHSHGSRYFALNLHSHWYRGTIEFRLFNSSLNATRVQTYIAIAMAIVQDGRLGHKRSVNKAFRLGGMADGTTDAAKAFFQFLTVVRYHAGMSLADYRNLKKIWKDSRAQQAFTTSIY